MSTTEGVAREREAARHDDAERAARDDFERRVYRRLTDTASADPALALPAPAQVRTSPGAGHIRLDWPPVDGAAGYLIERRGPDGDVSLLQHGGSDVPAVPSSPFADTGVESGVDYAYRIAAVTGADQPAWHWSGWVDGTAHINGAAPLELQVDAAAETGRLERVWQMIGSERLTQLRMGDDGHGNDIGTEFAEAFRIAAADLGVTHVRAHAILHDDNHVVSRDDDGGLVFDFSTVDACYDQLLGLGLRPVVELSFMPAALAREPDRTVFAYHGIISLPAEWAEWRAVVRALAQHLVDRYGIDEVSGWAFEVWNEPNLEVFWTGSQQDYFRLYDESVAALREVDARLRVGGPSTAAGEWIEALCRHAADDKVRLDFVTSHTYGNLPVDSRPSLRRHGFDGIPVWWTEWGVGSTHFGEIHDGLAGAPFVLSGLRDVQGRMQALAYWVISDHFEELGRPQTLFHNGFGLLTVGNLRKARYWALHLAAHQGDHVLASTLTGDGAQVLVREWATKHDDGTIDVLVWNGTVNAEHMRGNSRFDRTVAVTVSGLTPGGYRVSLARIDTEHSDIRIGYPAGTPWPDAELWRELRARDHLHQQQLDDVEAGAQTASWQLELPMPGVARLRLTPHTSGGSTQKEGSP
jgi:xylan 1,4-beta-xylosidase